MKRLFLLGLPWVLISCGPSQTARQQEESQEQTYIRQQQQSLSPYAGCYTGTIFPDRSGGTQKVSLEIYLSSSFQPVVGRNKYVEIPTLQGYVEQYDGDVLGVLNMSAMATNNHLVMWSSAASATSNNTVASTGLDVVAGDGHLSGHFFMPGLDTTINLDRADSDTACQIGHRIEPPSSSPNDPEPPPISKPEPPDKKKRH